MKIKRASDELLKHNYISIPWKQWLCWIKIIQTGLKTFRTNGKLIISNFTLMALPCQRFFQINSYFRHKGALQIVIAENTSLPPEQISFCFWDQTSSPSPVASFCWTIKQRKHYTAARWDCSRGPGRRDAVAVLSEHATCATRSLEPCCL